MTRSPRPAEVIEIVVAAMVAALLVVAGLLADCRDRQAHPPAPAPTAHP